MKEKTQRMKEENEEMKKENDEMENETQDSTLTEHLTLCHEHLSVSISVQTNKSLSTQGDPSNAVEKFRPDYLQPWEDFIDTQKETLETPYSIYPASKDMPRVFDSRNFIKYKGTKVALCEVPSDQALQRLHYDIVEMPVTKIVQHLKESLDGVSDQIKLGGGIQISNHINSLSDKNGEVAQRL